LRTVDTFVSTYFLALIIILIHQVFHKNKQHITVHLLLFEANKIYANLLYIMTIYWWLVPRSTPKTVHRIDGELAEMAHKINKALCKIPNAFAVLVVQISIPSFIAA